jgi:hypothetical protein
MRRDEPAVFGALARTRQDTHGGFSTVKPGPTRQEILAEERKRLAAQKRARKAAKLSRAPA